MPDAPKVQAAPGRKPPKDERTRWQRLSEGDSAPPLPECDHEAMVQWLFEAGPVVAGGMGPASLSHSEIAAWSANTGVPLSSWDARMLRRLSQAYLAQSQGSTAFDAPPPWQPEPEPERRIALATHIRSVLRG